jgi:hypothetical protein
MIWLISLQFVKSGKKTINKVIDERVRELKDNPFKYQKLYFNEHVLTLFRLYEAGIINFREYITEKWNDIISVEFMSWVMKAATKYDTFIYHEVFGYVEDLSDCISVLKHHNQHAKVERLRLINENFVDSYLNILRWSERYVSNKSIPEGSPTTQLEYEWVTSIHVEDIHRVMIRSKWNALPKTGKIANELAECGEPKDKLSHRLSGGSALAWLNKSGLRMMSDCERHVKLGINTVKDAVKDTLHNRIKKTASKFITESKGGKRTKKLDNYLEDIIRDLSKMMSIIAAINSRPNRITNLQVLSHFLQIIKKVYMVSAEDYGYLPGSLSYRYHCAGHIDIIFVRLAMLLSEKELETIDPANVQDLVRGLRMIEGNYDPSMDGMRDLITRHVYSMAK